MHRKLSGIVAVVVVATAFTPAPRAAYDGWLMTHQNRTVCVNLAAVTGHLGHGDAVLADEKFEPLPCST